MSYNRFSFNISDRAEEIIQQRIQASGETKNSAINSLIEQIPEMEKQMKYLKERENELLERLSEIEGMYDQQTVQVNGLIKERNIVRSFFGIKPTR